MFIIAETAGQFGLCWYCDSRHFKNY